MTTRELADRVGVSFEQMAEILEESRDMGIVVPTPRGWRLTATAQRELGRALLDLVLPTHDESRAATHRDDMKARKWAA
ncbi:MAG TPA: hypothetical protein VFG75_07970 [Gaiella sp.]|nr:hypothetical protein [Gaiella sp.]